MTPRSQPGDRLERALAAFLAGPPATRGDADALLQRHPDLADLLNLMMARSPHPGGTVAAEPAAHGDPCALPAAAQAPAPHEPAPKHVAPQPCPGPGKPRP